MRSILILNQDPQDTHDGLGFPFEWSPVQSEGDPQLLQLLQLLQVDVFWGSESGANIWPWCHLEDYVRVALTTRYFAFDDMVVRQLAEISELVNSHDGIVLRELQRYFFLCRVNCGQSKQPSKLRQLLGKQLSKQLSKLLGRSYGGGALLIWWLRRLENPCIFLGRKLF